ncbi:MAG: hypothetical protein IJY89_06020 [Clostridia bacterium]|nr:hypothetical protein [Clostridia bacterium]
MRVITASGHATSDTGTQLHLWVDWSIETLEDGSYKVKAIVYLDSYSLFCRERTGQNKLTIGDTPFVYSTPALSYNRNTGKHHTKFTEAEVIYTAETLPEQLTISASWFYNGTYSKIPISTIIASTVIDTTVL